MHSLKLLRKRDGFTIVELLVVIVVLAILAIIVVALYDNVATQAYDSSLKSDLKNAQDQISLEHSKKGVYPETAASLGLQASQGNTLTYARKPYGYCLTASNPEATSAFQVRSVEGGGVIQEGSCSPSYALFVGSETTTGFADGAAADARFNATDSNDIAVTADGTVYVSDFNNRRIRKITTSGEVSTVAGTGSTSCSTTSGAALTLNIGGPTGLAYSDATKTLYFLACSGSRLVKLTQDGTMTQVSGGGGTGACSGSNPSYYWARGLIIGPEGWPYVIGTENMRICKVNPSTGEATLIAGSTQGFTDNVPGPSAQFNWPWTGAFDKNGNLNIKDARNHRIRQIAPNGTVTTLSGAGTSGITSGPAATATFYYYGPHGMAMDQYGTMYVQESNSLRSVSPTGNVTYLMSVSGGSAGMAQAMEFGPDGTLYALTRYGIMKITL